MENISLIIWGILAIAFFVILRICYLLGNYSYDRDVYHPYGHSDSVNSKELKEILFKRTSRLWQLIIFLPSAFVLYCSLSETGEEVLQKLIISTIFGVIATLSLEVVVRVCVVLLKGIAMLFEKLR